MVAAPSPYLLSTICCTKLYTLRSMSASAFFSSALMARRYSSPFMGRRLLYSTIRPIFFLRNVFIFYFSFLRNILSFSCFSLFKCYFYFNGLSNSSHILVWVASAIFSSWSRRGTVCPFSILFIVLRLIPVNFSSCWSVSPRFCLASHTYMRTADPLSKK